MQSIGLGGCVSAFMEEEIGRGSELLKLTSPMLEELIPREEDRQKYFLSLEHKVTVAFKPLQPATQQSIQEAPTLMREVLRSILVKACPNCVKKGWERGVHI